MQPTRCNNNGLLIIPVSSTFFGQLFLLIFRSTKLRVTAFGIMHPGCGRLPAGNIVGALYHKL